jgi:hypothetical protein
MLIAGADCVCAQDDGQACVVQFTNNDELRGRLVALRDGRLIVRPEMAPSATLRIGAKKVQRVVFPDVAKRQERAPDRLRLRNGSVLAGRFVSIDTQCVRFEVAGHGELRFPLDVLEDLIRGVPPRDMPAQSDRIAFVSDQGDVVYGQIRSAGAGRIAVEGALNATLAYERIKAIVFPLGNARATPKSAPLVCSMTTSRGVNAIGVHPRLADGRLTVELPGEQRLSVSGETLVEMAFVPGGGIVARVVLVWGLFADRDDEYRKTLEVVRAHLRGWDVVEDFSESFDGQFRRRLMRSQTLLIPEMEKWNRERGLSLASQLAKLARPFLDRGGNVVFCGVQSSHMKFLRRAGLLDVASQGAAESFEFTEQGKRLSMGVGDGFKRVNATTCYSVGSAIPAYPLAANGASAAIVGRRVGRGWVVLLGMDYYQSNEKTQRILINSILLK